MEQRDRLRVFVADDEEPARERLAALLAAHRDLMCVGEASDGREATAGIHRLRPDIVLLDIDMPGATGMTVADGLQGGAPTAVIFVTAHPGFALEAFDVDAVDYLLKPATPDRLSLAIARARRWLLSPRASGVNERAGRGEDEAYASSLALRTRGGARFVDVRSIEWIEAARDYVVLHTPERAHLMRGTMDAMERSLDPALMVRVSRSAIVRRTAVRSASALGRGLCLAVGVDEVCIRVGTTYQRTARRIFGPLLSTVSSAQDSTAAPPAGV